MPELPEVETIRRGLQKTVLGKTIKSVEVLTPKIISLGPKTVSNVRSHSTRAARLFQRRLAGQKIKGIKRRAKMLMFQLSPSPGVGRDRGRGRTAAEATSLQLSPSLMGRGVSMWMLVHLKMTGQLIFAKKGERKIVKILNIQNAQRLPLPHKHTHAIFTFQDGSKLFYNDLRQFGYLRLIRDEDTSKVKELRDYGPEPFSAEFTLEYLLGKAKRRPALTVKQFLTDPKEVAGIGNIYSDEILFWAKLRPQRRLRSLDRSDWQVLLKSIPKVLKEGLKYQGSSVGDFFKVDGSEGTYGKHHMVYGRYGERCKVCGEVIGKVKLGGRTGSYCPHCQK